LADIVLRDDDTIDILALADIRVQSAIAGE
jgi:hypothetical protein